MWMHLLNAARAIRQGGVIAYPTEGVYGLGCDPLNEAAVRRLLAIKERSPEAGLILLGADMEQLRPFMVVSDTDLERMNRSWPGPVTWLVPASERVPALVRGRHSTVAVRVSGHPLARRLASLAGTALVSTSANRSGCPAAVNVYQVQRRLGRQLDFIVNEHCQQPGRPSTIIDLASGSTIR